ncbi:MAG: Zn-dependent alcohol dehydrogenase [Betaproteobacteria bacterium]|nr:Zn-dependent alcohol dehydrogenase [Betaproteobacteria bacterium]
MTRRGKAVVAREANRPVVVEAIDVESPRRDEIMLKVAACGVCHSDLSAINGTIAAPLPMILGHEGAGTVVEVGEGVTGFAVGDAVISSFVNMCGKCRYCLGGRPNLCDVGARTFATLPDGTLRTTDAQGLPLNIFSACGVMAEYATLNVNNAVRIAPGMPMPQAALISCGVMTGVGAAINTARVEAGASALVIGAGGVGLNVIQGCVIAGAAVIIAVDLADHKLETARQFGATHLINAGREENLVKAVKKITGGGADYAFECIGMGKMVEQAYRALRRGGKAVVVGVARGEDATSVKTASLTFEEKTLTGSYYGSARPLEDFPRLIGLYHSKTLKLDELITRRYGIDEAPQAFADLEAGRNARGVIVFG